MILYQFQNQEYADVYPIKTENRGWGLCAGSLLPKGTFVIQYIGEVYSLDSEYGMKKDAYSYPTDDIEIVSLNELNGVLDVGYIGNFPSSSNEIMISNYLADFIISRGIKVYNNDELSDYYPECMHNPHE